MDQNEEINSNYKLILDYNALEKVVEGLYITKRKVVVTIGTWDLLHIGHVRYLRKARNQGNVLIVGVDSDRVVKKLKGELRPVVPFSERCEMLSYQSCVDYVTVIDDIDKKGNWLYGLLKKIEPDVFVAEEQSYSQKQLTDIKKLCKKLVVLQRQAQTTSTTKMIQLAVKRHLDQMYKLLENNRK